MNGLLIAYWREWRPYIVGLTEMSEVQKDQQRTCIHCMIVDLIDDFFAEHPIEPSDSDEVDTAEADEVIDAVAKLVAELTSRQDVAIRRQLIEQLMSELTRYDDEFRREDAMGTVGSHSRH